MKRSRLPKVAGGMPKDPAARRRTDFLDKSPRRRGAASLVKAPLRSRPNRPEGTGGAQADAGPESREARRRLADQLWQEYHRTRGESARDALWLHYQCLLRHIAGRMKEKLPAHVMIGDLMGDGNLGLLHAITDFDPRRGVRFETYCVPRIRGAMLDGIRKLDWVPRLIRNKIAQFDRLVTSMTRELGRPPMDEELARRMKIDLADLARLREELDVKAQISLDGLRSQDGEREAPLRLMMADDEGSRDPSLTLQREEIREIVSRSLHANERKVAILYYFLNHTMKQIGEEVGGLSESRICQIHTDVLNALRVRLKAYAPDARIG